MSSNSIARKRWGIRATIAVSGALLWLAAFGAPAASADQTIQLSLAPSTIIDGVTTTVAVNGSSDTGGAVYVTLDSAGSTCGSNPSSDGSSQLISGDSVAGPLFVDSATATPAEGSYVVCAWLMPPGDDGSGAALAGPASMPLTVEPLQAALTLSAPVRVAYQQSIPATVQWQADAGGSLLVDILPSSYGPCTSTPADEPQYVGWITGQDGYTNTDPIGAAALTGTNHYVAREFAPDTYQICAWIEEASGSVVAGPVAVDVQMEALPGSRTYSGRTSQGLPLKVTTNGYSVQDIVYSARFSCGETEYFSSGLRWNGIWNDSVLTAANFGSLRIVSGVFAAKLDANPANKVNVRAKLSGSTLSGSLSALMKVGPPQFRLPATCRTGNVSFTASTQLPRRSRPKRYARRARR